MNLQIIVNRIDFLCKSKNISINQMLKECGLTKNVIDNMKKGSAPSIDKIIEIAKYFDVGTDYLLGDETKKSSPPDIDELDNKIMTLFRTLPKEKKELFLQLAKQMNDSHK